MADIALSDYISQKNIGQRLGVRPTERLAPKPLMRVQNRLSSASLATSMKAKSAVTAGGDARNKIIQLKRKNLADARDHLGELAKKIDARTRLNNKGNAAPNAANGLFTKPKEPMDMRDKLNRKNQQVKPSVQQRNVQQHFNRSNQQPSRGGAPLLSNNTTIVRTINTGRPAQPSRPAQQSRPVQQNRNVQPQYAESTRTVRQPVRSAEPVRASRPVRTVQSAPVVRKVIKQVPQPIRTVAVSRARTIRAAAMPAVRKVYRQPVQQQIVYEDDPYGVEYVEEPPMDDRYMEVLEEPMYEEPLYDEVYEEPEPVYQPRKVIVKRPAVQQSQRQVSYQRPMQARPQPLIRQSRPEPFVQQQQPNNYMQQQQQPFMQQQQPQQQYYQQQQQNFPQQQQDFPQQQQNGSQFYGNQQQQPLMNQNNMPYGPAVPPQMQNQYSMQQNQYSMQQQQQQRPMQQQQYNRAQQQNRPQHQSRSSQPSRSVQSRTSDNRTSNNRNPQSSSRPAPSRPAVSAPRREPVSAPRLRPAPAKAAPATPASKVVGQRVSVSNLHPVATADDIEELFENIGEVSSAKMVTSGTVVVVFRQMADARKAVEIYHNRKLDGQPMQVKILGSVFEK